MSDDKKPVTHLCAEVIERKPLYDSRAPFDMPMEVYEAFLRLERKRLWREKMERIRIGREQMGS